MPVMTMPRRCRMRTKDIQSALTRRFGAGPIPAGTCLRLSDGRATGHGMLPAEAPIWAGPSVDISGLHATDVEYFEVSRLVHELRLRGASAATEVYWDPKAGGWADIQTPEA